MAFCTCTSQSNCKKYRAKKSFLEEIVQLLLAKFLHFQIKMDKFNYLHPLNNDNDLLAVALLLADDFPTYDVNF